MPTDPMWRELFIKWPQGIPHRGIVVNTLGEAVPFKGFMIKNQTLLLERTNPDPMGTRYIFLTFDAISAVKLVDPIKPETFTQSGYEGQFSTV